ncbi:response regulator [Thiofilum flexile]|uniref:response regulator n=1 Tax=Thiofilum flexile TaxID=125627 RepID=UPI000368DA8C|nr:response regulator transcription factor [Thiofilum flexile]
MRVLVVEDDVLLGDALQVGLTQAGYSVDWVKDGRQADTALNLESYSAVVLDLGLPQLSGLEVLKRLRSRNTNTAVLILTAYDTIQDRIMGLDSGADDYLVKPFDMGELAARLRALVRRLNGHVNPSLVVGGVTLDPAAHTVYYQDQAIDISGREFATLHTLMLNAGRVLSRQQIESKLYAWGQEIESNAVEVHIHHLRRKLYPQLIETIRGVGYLLPRDKTPTRP